MVAKSDLKPYPYHDGTVNENAAVRTVRLVMPMCPIDGNPEIKQRDGSFKPNPNYTGEQNCQQVFAKNDQGVWDVQECIDRGHDPYYTRLRRAVIDEEVAEDGTVMDSKIRYVVEKRLNIMPISVNRRIASGQLLALARARGGLPMEDFGYASPCEFRSCSRPQKVETRVGKYCSERHARLILADARSMLLTVPSDPYSRDQAVREREDLLENLNISKVG